ncbi:MAG: hypothetical protein H6598_09770 [Flavobacteriales bacterium]|nr:hypothetical protein [Flavobacteriales bacterium]
MSIYRLCLLGFLNIFLFTNVNCLSPDTQKDEDLDQSISNIGSTIEQLRQLHKETLHSNPDSSIICAKKALDLYQNELGQELKADLLGELGMAYYFNLKFSDAVYHLVQAEQILMNLELFDKLSKLKNNLALVYEEVGLYDKALNLFFENLEYFEEHNDISRLSMTHNNVGICYEKLEQYKNARQHYFIALDIAPDEEIYTKAGLFLNLGIILDYQVSYDSAKVYYDSAIALYNQLEYRDYIADVYYNIAGMYLEKGDLDSALKYIDQTWALEQELGKSNFMTFGQKGRILQALGKDQKALEQYKKALELGKLSGAKSDYYDILSYLEIYYSTSGNYQLAYEYSVEMLKLRNEILDDIKVKEINKLEIEYQTKMLTQKYELSLTQLELKEQSLIVAEKNSKIKTILIAVTLVFLLMSIVLILLLFKRNILRKNLLEQKQQLYEKELTAQELILRQKTLENDKLSTEQKLLEEKKLTLELQLDKKNRELVSKTLLNAEKKETFEKILEILDNSIDPKSISNVKKIIKDGFSSADDWDELKLHFENVHPLFFEKLLNQGPSLSQLDLKHCAYVKMKISNKEISKILNISHRSVVIAHYRIKKKLGLEEELSLADFIETSF